MCVKTLFTVVVSYHKRAAAVACTVVTASHYLKATTVVAHLALRAPGNPAEESVARRLAWISMD